MGSPPQTQKPPREYRNPLKAPFTPPSGKFFHGFLQKARVVLFVILVPGLLAVQRISFFGENVHILYVAEMAQNFRFLLLMESPWIFNITNCNRKKIRCLKTNDFDK
jgi:hypothetical protein